MRRREFITLAFSTATWPLATRAQQRLSPHRVALIFSTSPVSEMAGPDPIHPYARVFVHALRDLGYIEGRNLVLERRSAEGKFERFPEIVRELVDNKVDVIVTVNDPMTQAAKEVTQTVPIVAVTTDPIERGYIQSLAHPGGNITGVTIGTGPDNLVRKVQLFKELLPGMTRVAYLQDKSELQSWIEEVIQTVDRVLSIKFLPIGATTPTDYANAFADFPRERIDGLIVGGGGRNFGNRQLILELAAKYRLPAMYSIRDYVAAGGLIADASDLVVLLGRLASYVDRILKGAKPADLPVEQPTKYVLTINLKTAKALGLTIPPSLLARADEVIE